MGLGGSPASESSAGTNGYQLAALGTALGIVIALPAGFIVSVLSFTLLGPVRSGSEVIVAILVGSAWLGAVFGCWLALRGQGRRAGRPALLLALASPLAWLFSSRFHGPHLWPALLVLLALLTILALPARFIALRWLGPRKSPLLSERNA